MAPDDHAEIRYIARPGAGPQLVSCIEDQGDNHAAALAAIATRLPPLAPGAWYEVVCGQWVTTVDEHGVRRSRLRRRPTPVVFVD
jgi:hypothetical protein